MNADEFPEALKAGDKISERWIAKLVRSIWISLGLSVAWPLNLVRVAGVGARISLAWYFELVLFELSGTLNKGSSAQATRLVWNVQSSRYEVPASVADTDRMTVYDMLGTFTGSAGDRGYAFFSRTSGRWEIVQLEC